ncbi:WXG100 family type VII secretion target [Yinghuangia sp. ASG 101]|uniref:WXG100 family type VII secretion target n=1 Tax=Yinghuangia sp. ASG 101 TaxID=2896848 RepID=UPI001E5C8BE6|nr:WXG100 family type VII secretion target [Yinghuangia sp. ASG 101]UGQ09907.1 WXG100 family type VII secretion target [Yinghuangia sp. ASG 101]
MGAPIVVTFDVIHQTAQQIRGINGDIRGRLDELKRQIDAVAAGWEGQAAADYQVRQAKWTAAQSELCNLLEQVASTLTKTAELYQQTETSNAKMWT